MRVAPTISLTDEQRANLTRLVNSRKTPVRLVERARIVLLADSGLESREIAVIVGAARGTVGKWRSRYAELGLAGIENDAPRPGRPRKISRAAEAACWHL